MLLTSLDQLKARELPNGWVSTEDATELLGREDLLFEEDIAHAVGTSFPGDGRLAMAHPGGKRGVRFGKVGLEVPFPTLKTDQPFTLSFWVRTPDHVQSSTILEQTASVTDSRNPKKKVLVGWRVTSSVQGAVTFEITDRKGQKINGLLPGDEALAPRTWQHVCIRYSGGRSKTSISILVNGKQGTPRPASEAYLEVDVLASSPLEMGSRFETGGLSDIRAYRRWLTEEEVELLAQQFKIQDLAANHSDLSQIEKTEDRDLIKQVLRFERQMEYVETLRSLAATELRRDFIKSRSTTSLVTQERTDASPRAWILKRGEYDQRGAEVFADVPGFLPPLPKGLPRNRLGLAEWLVDRGNPLTARVMVNRLWQSVFGRGIVRTSEDFGVMGSVPTHPELLDWLAVEFMESGWDVSGLLKLMVTSSTYRQDSRISRESSDKDPENAFLARGIRIRLDAEMIRDQALSLGGLLMPKAGGRSVNPYQPEGLWKVVAFAGSNTREFKQDEGEALYRRSIYTFWKRTSPPASMAAFDAPTREQCTVRRERTNTPLQALVLMNDTQFVEAARGFAVRTLEANNEDRKRVEWMLEHALYRPALKEDHLGVMSLIQGFREYFRESPDRAKALVSVGESKAGRDEDPIEIAAWTMAASTLMNRDDFVTKN